MIAADAATAGTGTTAESSDRMRAARQSADQGADGQRVPTLTVGRYLDRWIDDVVRAMSLPPPKRSMADPTDKRPDGYSPSLAPSILRRALRRAEAEGLITGNAAVLPTAFAKIAERTVADT